MDEREKIEAIAESLEFKIALEEFLKPFGIHTALIVWSKKEPDEITHRGASSLLIYGCPSCAAASMASAVVHLPMDMREPFTRTMKAIFDDPGGGYVMPIDAGPGPVH